MYYGLLIISIMITVAAQFYVTSTYNRYSKVSLTTNLTGAEAARKILDNNGLQNVKVVETSGFLSDHYNPKTKTLALSSSNYNHASIGGVAVSAHECGHAIQDKENYTFMRIRASLVPLVNFTSYAGYFALIIGIMLGTLDIIWLGIILEAIIILFQLVTLPVEFNASKRALKEVEKYNIFTNNEIAHGKTVLKAAALTYVASLATTIIEILRLVIRFTESNRD